MGLNTHSVMNTFRSRGCVQREARLSAVLGGRLKDEPQCWEHSEPWRSKAVINGVTGLCLEKAYMDCVPE